MAKSRVKHKHPQIQTVAVQGAQRVLTPKILWPYWDYSQNGGVGLDKYQEIDSDTFPSNEILYRNYQIFTEASGAYINRGNPQGISLGIKEFWDTFTQSADILFADAYFAPIHYRRLMLELNKLSNGRGGILQKRIHIYGRNNIQLLRECASKSRKNYPKVYMNCSIEIGELPSKGIDIHDRFAIMDGEIWHCGAAVGGMHGSLSAVTRGWQDTENRMKTFFINKGVNELVYK